MKIDSFSLIPFSQGDWNWWEIWNGASFWQENTSFHSHPGTFRSPNNIFYFHFLDIMIFSDASMASSSSWILWTFLWIFLNGGGLLRQFGNIYDKLTFYTIHYMIDVVHTSYPVFFLQSIFSSHGLQVILSVVELPAYIYAVISRLQKQSLSAMSSSNQSFQDFLELSCLDVADWLVGKEACLLPVTHLHWSCSHCIGFHWGFFNFHPIQ